MIPLSTFSLFISVSINMRSEQPTLVIDGDYYKSGMSTEKQLKNHTEEQIRFSFFKLPLELRSEILTNLSGKDIVNFINATRMDCTGFVNYIVDNPLETQVSNPTLKVLSPLDWQSTSSDTKEWISVLNITNCSMWYGVPLFEKLAHSYNIISINANIVDESSELAPNDNELGIIANLPEHNDELDERLFPVNNGNGPNCNLLSMLVARFGAHSTIRIENSPIVFLRGTDLGYCTIHCGPGVRTVIIYKCTASSKFEIISSTLSTRRIKNVDQSVYSHMNFETTRTETIECLGYGFSISDKKIVCKDLYLDGVHSLNNCDLRSAQDIFTSIVGGPQKKSAEMMNCSMTETNQGVMEIAFQGKCPTISGCDFSGFKYVMLDSLNCETKQTEKNFANSYSFLGGVTSITLNNFLHPLTHASPDTLHSIRELEIVYGENIMNSVSLDFPHLNKLKLSMRQLATQVPSFEGTSGITEFSITHDSVLGLAPFTLKCCFENCFKNLSMFFFKEKKVELGTEIDQALNIIAHKLVHLKLSNVDGKFLDGIGEQIVFPKLKLLDFRHRYQDDVHTAFIVNEI